MVKIQIISTDAIPHFDYSALGLHVSICNFYLRNSNRQRTVYVVEDKKKFLMAVLKYSIVFEEVNENESKSFF